LNSDLTVSYEIYYDGALIGAATTDKTSQTYPLAGIRLQMMANTGTTSVYYYDDVWVYTEK
jgi:hypothetical protein